jgi:hypothetical protein
MLAKIKRRKAPPKRASKGRKPQQPVDVTTEAIAFETARLQHAIHLLTHIQERMGNDGLDSICVTGWRSFTTNSVPRILTGVNHAYHALLRAEEDAGKDILFEDSIRKSAIANLPVGQDVPVEKKRKRATSDREDK